MRYFDADTTGQREKPVICVCWYTDAGKEEEAMKGTVPHNLKGVDGKCFETTFVVHSFQADDI